MIKREAQFTLLFRHWIKEHPRYTGAFELKQTEKNYLPFNAVKQHQLNALRAVESGGLLYKIPDDSRSFKPFDMFYMRNEEAYVVIKYPDFFCLIDVGVFEEESKKKRRSLTSERAKEIATEVIPIGKKEKGGVKYKYLR